MRRWSTPAPVVALFILDPVFESYGAAPKGRLGESLDNLGRTLERHGGRLILRRGDASTVLNALVGETGATRVVWSRLYDSRSLARDRAIEKPIFRIYDPETQAESFDPDGG